jgi:hypothetical protein
VPRHGQRAIRIFDFETCKKHHKLAACREIVSCRTEIIQEKTMSTTKRTTPTTAAPAAKPLTGQEAIEAGRRAYEDAAGGKQPPPSKLTQTQRDIADVLANILTHGASDDVVGPFLTAVARHFWHWRLDETERPEHSDSESVNKFAAPQAERWKKELTVTWARAARVGVAEPVAKDLAERIRFAVVEELRDTFEYFIRDGTPEEHRLMANVFVDHQSGPTGFGIPIATAFSQQLGRVKAYIEVPRYHRDAVEKYLECLEAKEMEVMKDESFWAKPENAGNEAA